MASDWRQSTWGEEISLEYGKRLTDYADRDGPVRVYGTNGPVGWTDEPLALGPGVILGRKGAYRGVHYSPDPFYVIDTAYYVRPKTELDMRWLYYAIVHHKLAEIDDGSPIPSTTRSEVYVRKLRVPEISEQRAIAEVLGALDDKIELNRQMNRTLEAMARAIFKAWFVDFEPVKAKAAGATSFRGMPQDVFDQLPARLTESELGPVPTGWEVKRLDECIHLTMGQSPPSEYYNKEGIGRPFHQGVTDYGARFPNHRVFCTADGRLAEPGDVLVSVRAPVGRINVAETQLVLGRGLAGLRHRRERQSFLLYQLYHIFAVEDAIGDGTIYKAVTKRFLSQMPILSPPEVIVDAFDQLACQFDDMIASLTREIRTLGSIRDTLLPGLISGEVRVPRPMQSSAVERSLP